MTDVLLIKKQPVSPIPPVAESVPRMSAPPAPTEAVQRPRIQMPLAAETVEVVPRRFQSLPQEMPAREFVTKVPMKSPVEAEVIPTRAPKLPTARTDPDSPRRLVPKQTAVRPPPRNLPRPQPNNLEVMNHVVVPRTQSSGPPQQSRRSNGPVRVRQPLRRPQNQARVPLPVRPPPENNAPPPPPPRNTQKPVNLIVIQDGRVVELSAQQQRDLALVLR
ncbi:hypothetical protein COOONC_17976 [Cooperia oncophora]